MERDRRRAWRRQGYAGRTAGAEGNGGERYQRTRGEGAQWLTESDICQGLKDVEGWRRRGTPCGRAEVEGQRWRAASGDASGTVGLRAAGDRDLGGNAVVEGQHWKAILAGHARAGV